MTASELTAVARSSKKQLKALLPPKIISTISSSDRLLVHSRSPNPIDSQSILLGESCWWPCLPEFFIVATASAKPEPDEFYDEILALIYHI
jgi:hypothetical protein